MPNRATMTRPFFRRAESWPSKEDSRVRSSRRKRSALGDKMVECGMPESLASHLAEQLNDKQNDRASFAFRGSGSAAAFTEEFCAEIGGYDFERTRCFFFNFG